MIISRNHSKARNPSYGMHDSTKAFHKLYQSTVCGEQRQAICSCHMLLKVQIYSETLAIQPVGEESVFLWKHSRNPKGVTE